MDARRIAERRGRRHTAVVVGTLTGQERRIVARGPVAEDAIFEIGSITKVFTALLLARMAVDGSLSLQERPFRDQPVTFADLAAHTAGLPRLPNGMYRRAVFERRDPYAAFSDDDLRRALRSGRARTPGRMRYSNFGAGVLGHLLAHRAGEPYAALLDREVIRPLGLADTSLAVTPSRPARLVDGHDRWGRRVPHWHFDALAPAGALRSTASDMLDFLDLHLRPPDSPLGRAARLTHEVRATRGKLDIGLGWPRLPLKSGEHLYWHNGGTAGFRSFAGFVPALDTAVVVLSNCARSVDAIALELLQDA